MAGVVDRTRRLDALAFFLDGVAMTFARAAVVLVIAATVIVGCQRPSGWERSRTAYCDQVHQHEDTSSLEAAALQLRRIALEPDDARAGACETVQTNLAVMRAELHELFTAGLVVSAGRPSSTAHDGVLVSTLPSEALQRYDASFCRLGRYDAASDQVREIRAAVDAALHDMLAECRTVGWGGTGWTSPPSVH